MLNIHAFVIPY